MGLKRSEAGLLSRGRHRTVRIVEPKRPPRGAYVSLAVALSVAFLVYLSWLVWRPDDVAKPLQRGLSDVALDYRCENGHRFQAPGRIKPRECPQCETEAWVVNNYVCPKHGVLTATVHFADDWTPKNRHMFVSFDGTKLWPVEEAVNCPHCGQTVRRVVPDPLTRVSDQRGG